MSWLRYFRRVERQRELENEIQSYLSIAIDENVAAGMKPEEAVLAARRKFGNTTLVKETVRDMNSFTWLEDLWNDLRYGVRVLRLNPGFFMVATLSLALGIGANTAIFQLLNAVRMRPLPVANPEQLGQIQISKETQHCCSGNFSSRYSNLTYPMWEQIRDRQQGFSSVFAFGDHRFNISERGETQYVEGLWVSGTTFKTLGVTAAFGRLLDENDDRPGCGSPAAVLSYPFWQRHFGGDRQILGKKLAIEGKPFEIAGVTAPGFFGLEVGRSMDVMLPMCSEPYIGGEDSHLAKRHHWWLAVMGRLKPGWTMAQAKAQIAAVSPQIFESTVPPNFRPDKAGWYAKYTLSADPASSGLSALREDYEDPLWMLLGIAAAVLLIACANLANLMLARSSVREREMAVRLAIGAGRGRLVRQLLTESSLLTIAGTALGAFLANSLSTYLVTFLSTANAPLFLDLAMDWRMLAFTTAIAVVTCLLFGLTPALRAAGTSPGSAMKAGGRSVTADRSRFGLRRALVTVQVALSLVLLAGALLFGKSLRNLTVLDPGLRTDGLLATGVDFTNLKYTPERRGLLAEQLLTRLRSTAGVDQASSSLVLQLSGNYGWNDTIQIVGRKPNASERMIPWFNRVSSGYFATMGMPLVAGRDFNQRDTRTSPYVAVVTEKFKAKFLNGADPIGKQFKTLGSPGEPDEVYEIVGLVKDSKYQTLKRDIAPIVFISSTQDRGYPTSIFLLTRSRDSAGALTAVVQRAILEENSELLLKSQPFKELVADSLLRDRLMATLSGFFGLLAAVLATVGLYGVVSYMVARRKNEIGIRVALGANRGSIIRLVIRESAILLAIGLVIGIAITASGARVTQSLLYGMQARDPLTIGLAAALLAAVSLGATLMPALRAARLDPVDALREE